MHFVHLFLSFTLAVLAASEVIITEFFPVNETSGVSIEQRNELEKRAAVIATMTLDFISKRVFAVSFSVRDNACDGHS